MPIRLTIVFGERHDLKDLAALGDLWAERNDVNRPQVQALWADGVSATLFDPGELWSILGSADEHHPTWSTLVVLR